MIMGRVMAAVWMAGLRMIGGWCLFLLMLCFRPVMISVLGG